MTANTGVWRRLAYASRLDLQPPLKPLFRLGNIVISRVVATTPERDHAPFLKPAYAPAKFHIGEVVLAPRNYGVGMVCNVNIAFPRSVRVKFPGDPYPEYFWFSPEELRHA